MTYQAAASMGADASGGTVHQPHAQRGIRDQARQGCHEQIPAALDRSRGGKRKREGEAVLLVERGQDEQRGQPELAAAA